MRLSMVMKTIIRSRSRKEVDDEDEDVGTVEIIQHHVAQWLS